MISSGVVQAAKTRSRGALIRRVIRRVAVGATFVLMTSLSFVLLLARFPDSRPGPPANLPKTGGIVPSSAAPPAAGGPPAPGGVPGPGDAAGAVPPPPAPA